MGLATQQYTIHKVLTSIIQRRFRVPFNIVNINMEELELLKADLLAKINGCSGGSGGVVNGENPFYDGRSTTDDDHLASRVSSTLRHRRHSKVNKILNSVQCSKYSEVHMCNWRAIESYLNNFLCLWPFLKLWLDLKLKTGFINFIFVRFRIRII